MAIEPAAISARPAVTTIPACATAPLSPAASANGTVSPSAIPMTTSRTIALAVKWLSMCGVSGMCALCRAGRRLHVADQLLDLERLLVHLEHRIADRAERLALRYRRGDDRVRHEVGPMLLHVAQHRPAVDARHHQIEQDDVEAVARDRLDGLAAVARRLHGKAVMPDDRGQHRADRFVVVDDERAHHDLRRSKFAAITSPRPQSGETVLRSARER